MEEQGQSVEDGIQRWSKLSFWRICSRRGCEHRAPIRFRRSLWSWVSTVRSKARTCSIGSKTIKLGKDKSAVKSPPSTLIIVKTQPSLFLIETTYVIINNHLKVNKEIYLHFYCFDHMLHITIYLYACTYAKMCFLSLSYRYFWNVWKRGEGDRDVATLPIVECWKRENKHYCYEPQRIRTRARQYDGVFYILIVWSWDGTSATGSSFKLFMNGFYINGSSMDAKKWRHDSQYAEL